MIQDGIVPVRGGKRSIVAVARKLSGRMRTILLRNEFYQVGLVQ